MQCRNDHVVLLATVTLRERLGVQDGRQFSVSIARADCTMSATEDNTRPKRGTNIVLAPSWLMLSNIIPFGPMECASELTLTIRTGSFAIPAVLESVGMSSLVKR